MNYQDKIEARRKRLEARAAKAARESKTRLASASALAGVMNGQPILIGHHSEKRHRRDLERLHDNTRKGIELHREAADLSRRAAAVGTGGISADDPDAPEKIRARIAELEAAQARDKAINRAVRSKNPREALAAIGAPEALLTPDFCGRIGIPGYVLNNRNANLRRLRGRLEVLERPRAAGGSAMIGVWTVTEDPEENRILLSSPDVPLPVVRAQLKAHGFRWSPTRRAWVRQLTDDARYAAREALK